MRIAIAGAGCLAKYFTEEFPKAGHDIVILTRSHKPHFDGVPGVVAQRITDYSSGSACGILHLALVQACQKSTKCKRFIPSEFGANLETHPHFANPFLHPVMDLLRSQTEVKWTTQAIGWLADYLVPRTNRYHPDIGPMHPLDHSTKTMTIPEDGKYPVSVVSARDCQGAGEHPSLRDEVAQRDPRPSGSQVVARNGRASQDQWRHPAAHHRI